MFALLCTLCYSGDCSYGARVFPLLPAYAGVFPSYCASRCPPATFPRVCGGVTRWKNAIVRAEFFSPRMRGCFLEIRKNLRLLLLFPAYAGVFRALESRSYVSFPRVCGGVSSYDISGYGACFSPRMRGCFH